jgi:hypothetical protein
MNRVKYHGDIMRSKVYSDGWASTLKSNGLGKDHSTTNVQDVLVNELIVYIRNVTL